MRTATELNEAEKRGQHIERYGHHAIYGAHDCPLCQMHWRCRKSICKREQESLCKDCESKILVANVQAVGARLHELLYTPVPITLVPIHDEFAMNLYESLKQELRLQVDGLIQQARLIQEME